MSTATRPAQYAGGRMTKKQQAENERQDAIAQLRELFPVGSTVHTVLRHVSQSGMLRTFSVLHADERGNIDDVDYLIHRAGIAKRSARHAGVEMGGCGMDMGFALAYNMARTIYRDGFPCTGVDGYGRDRCPSNDHVNERGEDRDFTPGRLHSDPGYALNHRHV